MPHIQAETVGVLSYLNPHWQARALVFNADRAPRNRGQQFIVDPSVRDHWRLASDKLHTAGLSWAETLTEFLDRTTVVFSGSNGSVTEALHKHLIFQLVGLFWPHRDALKADGVAILVILLPVPGTVSELVIHHQGRDSLIDKRTYGPSELVFAAFHVARGLADHPVARGLPNRVDCPSFPHGGRDRPFPGLQAYGLRYDRAVVGERNA